MKDILLKKISNPKNQARIRFWKAAKDLARRNPKEFKIEYGIFGEIDLRKWNSFYKYWELVDHSGFTWE